MIPSLLQIPSAVSDSKLHSVLPNNGKGDFQFDRSTGATRINRDGLIEEVGYFSSELVQNGNFSELGSELITNGDYATNSDWVVPTGWSINNGKAIANFSGGATGRLSQTGISFIQNKTYKVVFTISDYEQGNIRIEFRQGGGNTVSANYSGNGTYTLYQVAAHNHTQLSIRALADAVLKVDNVSVKQVDPNDRWTLQSGWNYGENKISKSTGSNRFFPTVNSWTSGAKFLFKLTVSNRTTGYLRIQNVGSTAYYVNNIDDNGDLRFIFNSIDANGWEIEAVSSFDGDVTNISVVEVQGDRPRLSYDITNGVVESQPHLLLEPSSTNLVTYSEDFSQSDWQKEGGATIESDVDTSPSGSINASYLKAPVTTNATVRITYTFSSTASQTYVGSIFVKKENVDYIRMLSTGATSSTLQAYYNVSDGTLGTSGTPAKATIEDYGNGWYRLGLIIDAVNTTASASFRIQLAKSDGAGIDDFDGTEKNLIWGAMLEQQSYATSYIPTAGTTITRAAETCNNSKPSVNSTEGVLYAEIAALADDGTNRQISISDGNATNRIYLGFRTQSNQVIGSSVSSGSENFINHTLSDTTVNFKLAFKYKQNDFSLFLNGVQAATDTSGNTPTVLNTLDFHNGDGTQNFYGKVKGLAVYNEALTDAQLIELTS